MTKQPYDTSLVNSGLVLTYLDKLEDRLFSKPETEPVHEYEWEPFSGPQTLGYNSKADILGYGGAGGGGKTDLLLGVAAKAHHKAVIFRRVFPNMRAIIERSRQIFNPEDDDASTDSYNETLHRWMLPNRKMLEFEACQHETSKENQRGRDRDFYGFDEVTEFSKSQVLFILAWMRTTIPGQRCRCIMTFNPPTNDQGMWVTDFFKPWLAYLYPSVFTHANPAAPGELRWYTTIDGKDTEVVDGRQFVIVGNTRTYKFDRKDYKPSDIYKPMSRTFIPAKLDDNPGLRDTNYRAVLQALPEPLRSQMLNGDFSKQADDNVWQVISTADYDRSVERWMSRSGVSTAPMTRIGLDVARGGKDQTVKAMAHTDGYCGNLVKIPGVLTPDGESVAKLVYLNHGNNDLTVAVDIIGVGSSPVDKLREHKYNVLPMYGSGKALTFEYGEEVPFVDPDSGLKCVNLRSGMYWNIRLLLEKDLIDLPPDPALRTAMLAHRWTPKTGGIQVLDKEAVKSIIGKSPDESDAVCYAFWIVLPIAPAHPSDIMFG